MTYKPTVVDAARAAALTLGEELDIGGATYRKVLIKGGKTAACPHCPLYVPAPDGTYRTDVPLDACDEFSRHGVVSRGYPCLPPNGAEPMGCTHGIVPVSDIPRLALKGQLL